MRIMTTYRNLSNGNFRVLCDGLNQDGYSVQGVRSGSIIVDRDVFLSRCPRGVMIQNGVELDGETAPTSGEFIVGFSELIGLFLSK